MITLFLIVILAQAQIFVTLEVCYLDAMATPWETRPDPQGRELFVRPDQVLLIKPMAANVVGVECVRVCAAHGCQYVMGSVQEILGLIEGRAEAFD